MTREWVAKRSEVQQLEAHSEKRARAQEKSPMAKKRPQARTQAVAIQQELQQKEAAPSEENTKDTETIATKSSNPQKMNQATFERPAATLEQQAKGSSS